VNFEETILDLHHEACHFCCVENVAQSV